MKQLTLVPDGGLSNRILAITSAISFAKEYGMQLSVIWFKDWGMGAKFHDLFTLLPNIENVKIKDAGFMDVFKYAKPIKSNLFLSKLYQKIKFDAVYFWQKEQVTVKQWYDSNINANKYYIFHCHKFHDNCNLLNVFSPVDSIQKRIDEQSKLLFSNTIGLHIRRTDFKASIKHSPLQAFIEIIQAEIVADSEVTFYVASDSREEKEKLVNLFGNHIIVVENILKRNTKAGVIDALIELYTLASTKKIYGSYQSSYSLLSSEINGKPLEILKK